MQPKDGSHPNLASIKEGRISKPIEDMSFQEQMAALRKDPRFRALVADIKTLSVDRQEALAAEMAANTDG